MERCSRAIVCVNEFQYLTCELGCLHNTIQERRRIHRYWWIPGVYKIVEL